MKRAREETAAAGAAVVGDERPKLTLAHEHALSLELARQCAALVAADEDGASSSKGWMASCGVTTCRVVSPGIVEVIVRAGRDDGFGAREWPFRIGGAGVGDDPQMAATLGTAPRSPVAARFDCPLMSMSGVDDAGFVDDAFWSGLGEAPSLRDICQRLACWLRGRGSCGVYESSLFFTSIILRIR